MINERKIVKKGERKTIPDFLISSIRRKIFSSFTIVIILVLFMLLISYFQLKNVRSSTEQIIPNSIQMNLSQDIALDILSLDSNIERFFLIGGVQIQEDIFHDLEHMTEHLESMKMQDNERMMPIIKELENIAAGLRKDILNTIETGITNLTSREMNEKIISIYLKIKDAKQLHRELTTKILTQLHDTVKEQESITDNMIYQFVTLGILVFLLAISASLLLAKIISKPIVELRDASNKVGEGKLDTQIQIESNDEIGQLAFSFNRMVENIQQSGKALRESEEKYRSTIDSIGIPIHVVDENLSILLFNKSFKQWNKDLGLETENLIGKNVFKVLPFLTNKVREEYKKVIKTGKVLITVETNEFDRKKIITETRKIPVLENNKVVRVITVIDDITERKHTAEIQSVLYQIANAVNVTKDLNELFKTIHNQLGKIIDTTNFYIALYDEENKILTAPYFVDQLTKKKPPVTLKKNGLTAYVIHSAKSIYLTEEKRSKLIKEGLIPQAEWKSKIWIGVPLITEKRVIGAIVVQSYTDVSLYSEKDLEILQFISDEIAFAISRKQTNEEMKNKSAQISSHQKELQKLYADSEVSRKSLLSILEDVVEKEKDLRESEEKFRILVQHSPLGIFKIDIKGNIEVVNPSLLKILGSPSEEETKKINLLTFPLLMKSGISGFVKECIKKGKSINGEFLYRSKWGKEMSINLFLTPVHNSLKQVVGVQGIIEDITERKKAEDKYINQLKNMIDLGISMRVELKLENLLHNICDMIIKSLGWRQVILSLRDYKTGTSRPVAMAGHDDKTVKNIFSKPPVPLERLNKFLRNKFKISRSYYIDHANWEEVKKYNVPTVTNPVKDLKTGGWHEKDLLLIPIQGKKNILGFISPDNPVSGKRPTKEKIQALEIFADQAAAAIENAQLYEELQDSENRFQDIAVNTGDWIWETDEKGRYTYCSPVVKQVLGYKYKEMLGKYFYDFFAPDERDKMKKAALNTFAKRQSFHNFINRNIHKDGCEVILETSGIPIIGANGELIGYRGVDRDITERKKAEQIQTTIYNISNAVNTAKDLDEFFEIIHAQLSKIIDTTNFYIALYEKEGDTISLPYHVDKKDRFKTFPAGKTITSYVIKKGKSLLATEKVFKKLEKAGEVELIGTPSKIWLGVPLKTEDEVIGVAAVQSYTDDITYTDNDMKILEFVSDQVAVAIDRKKKGEQIKKDLEEKIVMLMEIHHRVKNNMQVISSMLRMQSGYIRDEQDKQLFKDSLNRVKSMALIHEKLYQTKDLANIDFAEYVKSLAMHLFSTFGFDTYVVRLNTNIKDVFLDINTAIPCGLIINELISNSLKYAFPEGKEGIITINLAGKKSSENKKEKIYTLVVSDNGVGFPKDIDFRNTESLGLQLVNTLVDQLHGDIKLNRRGGTSFKIVFKRSELKKRSRFY